MSGLLLAQVMLPASLLAILMVARFRSRMLWLATVAATAAVLVQLALMGLWIIPPGWVWPLYVAAWLLAVLRGVRRWNARSWLPDHRAEWVFAICASMLVAYSAHESLMAWRGRAPPTDTAMPLAFPLRAGRYVVLNGGNDIRINAHLKTRDTSVPRFARWRGNGYAIDVVALDRWGLRARGIRPVSNRDYEIFGRTVLAPCAGKVVQAVDGRPDMTPPQYDSSEHLAGNHLLLACGDRHVVLAHFQRGSIRVGVGDQVKIGQPLAQVGNSGGSDEAHLHFHVQSPGPVGAPLGGEPVPATFQGRFLVRGNVVDVLDNGSLHIFEATLPW